MTHVGTSWLQSASVPSRIVPIRARVARPVRRLTTRRPNCGRGSYGERRCRAAERRQRRSGSILPKRIIPHSGGNLRGSRVRQMAAGLARATVSGARGHGADPRRDRAAPEAGRCMNRGHGDCGPPRVPQWGAAGRGWPARDGTAEGVRATSLGDLNLFALGGEAGPRSNQATQEPKTTLQTCDLSRSVH